MLVNGAWRSAHGGAATAVCDPATGKKVAQVPQGDDRDARDAVDAAAAALRSWRTCSAKDRGQILRRWYDLVMAAREDLAQILTLEQGKPIAEARAEVASAASFIDWFAEEGRRVYGETIPAPSTDQRLVVCKQPVGVCAAITPWNFPSAMVTRKVAPALAAGCTIVVKPAEQTPLSALALGALAEQAGLPAGVLNIVTGDPVAIGGVLTGDPNVRKLSFTGSTKTGRLLMEQCAPTLKRLSMELGGNAPFIVFEDADLDAAVQGALAAKYRNSGQTCICVNRFLVHEQVAQAFAARMAKAAEALRVGHGCEESVEQGPLIDAQALAKMESMILDATDRGARLLCGGKLHAMGGTFFQPTVITDVTPDMALSREEIFGPIASIATFRNEEEAIAMANATEYGLAAYFYSRDMARLWRVGNALEYGMVGINTGLIANETAPFGGVKQSGFGREGSRYGIEEYLDIQYLCVGGIDS
ncbi:succinate-semialdehyde dehydrogenase [Luminiphilus syltensis NOR5-1B]|uniref:Succinate-semialdehyde dehydrogenase n=2 Tax=Luminiphilus TaxID=1341118 RepID=B8KY59_9GAMM|nr:succinate-semialdehyde dehydrogenase [Luminiphilus syltensis NOR5-1B]